MPLVPGAGDSEARNRTVSYAALVQVNSPLWSAGCIPWKSGAVMDDQYRYLLWRMWDEPSASSNPLVWIMLNPSTADGTVDDPTIHRCISFAKRDGYTGIQVVNLFPFRTSSPKLLKHWYDAAVRVRMDEKLGIKQAVDKNLATIKNVVTGRQVILAWGAHGDHYPNEIEHIRLDVQTYAKGVYRLGGLTQGGQPRHPLYLGGDEVKQRVFMATGGHGNLKPEESIR